MIGSHRVGGGLRGDRRRSDNPRRHGGLGPREDNDRNSSRPTSRVASSGARRPTLPRGGRRLKHKQPHIVPAESAPADAAAQADLPLAIEDYALIGDCTSAALVGRNGSIDWLCWPRFDSSACFAALLGTSDHGRWRIHPADPAPHVSRAYRDGTMVLETVFSTKDRRIAVIDFMPPAHGNSSVVRLVEGRAGKVTIRLHLKLRFDYGSSIPWVTKLEDNSGLSAIVGPSRVVLRTPVELRGDNLATVAEFSVAAGECVPFVLTHGPSHLAVPAALDWQAALRETEDGWRRWWGQCCYHGPWKEAVQRSLLTLKALTDARRVPGVTGCCAAPRVVPSRSRSCTGWPASDNSTNGRCHGCPVIRAPRQCASATQPALPSLWAHRSAPRRCGVHPTAHGEATAGLLAGSIPRSDGSGDAGPQASSTARKRLASSRVPYCNGLSSQFASDQISPSCEIVFHCNVSSLQSQYLGSGGLPSA